MSARGSSLGGPRSPVARAESLQSSPGGLPRQGRGREPTASERRATACARARVRQPARRLRRWTSSGSALEPSRRLRGDLPARRTTRYTTWDRRSARCRGLVRAGPPHRPGARSDDQIARGPFPSCSPPAECPPHAISGCCCSARSSPIRRAAEWAEAMALAGCPACPPNVTMVAVGCTAWAARGDPRLPASPRSSSSTTARSTHEELLTLVEAALARRSTPPIVDRLGMAPLAHGPRAPAPAAAAPPLTVGVRRRGAPGRRRSSRCSSRR